MKICKNYFFYFVVFLLGLGVRVSGQYNLLHYFNDTTGENPVFGKLTLLGDGLYGMTPKGGANSIGCIFSLYTNGSGYKDLMDFNGTNGSTPLGSLTLVGNKLYGMTQLGGANDSGCIFSIDTNGSGYKDLHDFVNPTGVEPQGSLLFAGSKLYGMTTDMDGVIFSLDTNGTGYKVLLNFNGPNGIEPYGSLIISGKTLYGMTYGAFFNYGNVFAIDTNGSNYKNLLDFQGTYAGSNGAYPWGDVTLLGNKLYGMTSEGGANGDGLIFSIDTNGGNYKDMLDFAGSNGNDPRGSLVVSNSKTLVGVTAAGGSYNWGCIFSIDTSGSNYNQLYNFSYITINNGGYPYGSPIISGDEIYGMTEFEGKDADGVIFRFNTCTLISSITNYTNISCYNGTNGSATITTTGGASPFTYSWSPTGGSNATASNLSAGTYTVTVTDNNGCSSTSAVTITGTSVLTDSIAIIASNECVCKKTLIAFPSGGTPPYTYLWSNGITTDTNLNVAGGLTYTATVTDNNGCTNIDSITVPNLSIIVTTSQTNVLCYGESNGSASVVSPSGSGFYYTWAPGGQTTAGISGLSAGSYTVTVVDSIPSCEVTQSVNITQPPILTVSAALNSEVQCYGEDDGSASASPGGGTPAYTYHWSDGETNATATALPAGLATVIVTDANGCTSSDSVTITQPPPLVTSSNTNQGCGPLVEFQINASGGVPPYTYDWPPGFGNPGNYDQLTMTCPTSLISPFQVTVYDANGCSSFVFVYFNTYLQIQSVTQTNVTCYGGNNGSITVGLCGSGLLQYTISPGGTYSSYNQPYTFTNLTAGTYTISVENQLYCNTGPYIVTITQPPAIVVTTTVTAATCTSGGTATASASNGVSPYTYSWSNSQTTSTISGLSMGTYTLNVTDSNGCTGSSTAVITQPATLSILVDTLPDNGSCTGSAWAMVSGGTVPYTYLWTGGLTTDTINNQCAGNYCCTVSDSNGCIDSICVTIPLILTTGTNQLSVISNQLSVYPNPSSGIFNILFNISESTPLQIDIYDVLGQKVLSEIRQPADDNLIDISEQPDGIYLYRVLNAGGGLLGEGKIIVLK